MISLNPRRRPLVASVSAVAVAAVVAGGIAALSTGQATAAVTGAPYTNASLPVAERVADLVSRMSLDEKIGQMTQVDLAAISRAKGDLATYRIGSVLSGGGSDPGDNTAKAWATAYDELQRIAVSTPLGIPMIYGVDAVHGHNNVVGATVFPHNIGLGATRDAALVERIGEITAKEMAGTGIDWNFAPCIAVARNDRWGRTYESYGETPEIVSPLGAASIRGLQGTSLSNPLSVLATAKHYLGDGGTTDGTDQGNTQGTEADIRAIHLAPYTAAIEAGAGSVMVSFSSINNQKMHGSTYWINDVLKGELGFDGFVVTDWGGMDQLDGQVGSNGSLGFTAAEVATAINAGIDMVMVPNAYKDFITFLKQNVADGTVPQARVDDAVRRILAKKFELGLFERPYTDTSLTSQVGSAEHRAVAREAVRRSMVLLKNENGVLPLKKGSKIFVAGKNADNIGNQSGGWTIDWQGKSGNITTGTTILSAIRSAAGSGSTVTYSLNGTGIDTSYDVAVAVIGEQPYAEGRGDLVGSMTLDGSDRYALGELAGSGVPLVVVLVSGRPMDIASELGKWDALMAAWLPGTEGAGVTDVLFGDHAPTGTLPVTWMQSSGQQPINDGDGQKPLFPLGYGLTYEY